MAFYLVLGFALIVVAAASSEIEMKSFESDWTTLRNPCGNKFMCPTNHKCVNDGMRVGSNVLNGFWLSRAICHPLPIGQCAEADCPKGTMCQSTDIYCENVSPKDTHAKMLCQFPYLCIDEKRWYGKKTRVTREHD